MTGQHSAKSRRAGVNAHVVQVTPVTREDNGSASSSTPEEPPMWRQIRLFLGNRLDLIIALLAASVVAGFCESLILALLAEIAAALVVNSRTISIHLGPAHVQESVNQMLVAGLAVTGFRVLLQWLLSYLPSAISSNVQRSMRIGLFAAFTRAAWSVQAADSEGKFQELVTGQVLQATQGVIQATTALTSVIMLIVLVLSALVVEPATALVVIAAGLALSLVIRPLNKIGSRRARALSAAQLSYATGVYDAVSLAEETQVFGVGEAQERQVTRLVDAARNTFFETQFLGRLISGGYQAVVMLLLFVGLAVLKSIGSGAGLASLGAVVLLLIRASSYGQQVQGNYHLMHQCKPFLDRLGQAEERYRASPVERGTDVLDVVPSIEFKAVSYSYVSGNPVLQDVTFDVAAGEVIGVVGPTGAGKSTLVQLLLGLRQPQSGQYLVAGASADRWSLDAWTRLVAYVPQEPRLLHGTVAENIGFLRNLDQATIERAARQAYIHDEIMNWEDGYDTVISQRVKAVSGGQRQRICLARALAGNPSVLVLDEPTSALDPRSESLVQESLTALKGKLTLFVIAHRFSTLSVCDRVMVVRSGCIEAFAPADELVQTNDFYNASASLSNSGVAAHAHNGSESPSN